MIAPVCEPEPDEFPDESPELFPPEPGVADCDAEEDVADGKMDREAGEFALRQVWSSERPTNFMSEQPPLRPWESVMIQSTEVPPLKSAIHWKLVGPVGG